MMKRAALLLAALALVGCGKETVVGSRSGAVVETVQACYPTGHLWIAEFKGFPEFADHQVMGEAFDTTADYCPGSYSDGRLIVSSGITNWAPCPPFTDEAGFWYRADAYTYILGETRLFPSGSEFGAFEFSLDGLLCADVKACSREADPFFFDVRGFTWHGQSFEVPLDSTGNYVRNQVYTHASKGWRARLVINEAIRVGNHFEANGAHLTITGHGAKVPREVTLSHVDMNVCQP